MERSLWAKRAAASLLVLSLLRILAIPAVAACPSYLECGNFTSNDKIQDCNYITSQGLNDSEEQEVLCILWDQGYSHEGYENPEYDPLEIDFSFDYREIDASSFILAFKIVLFLLFNYFVYCMLTKSSWMRKWFAG